MAKESSSTKHHIKKSLTSYSYVSEDDDVQEEDGWWISFEYDWKEDIASLYKRMWWGEYKPRKNTSFLDFIAGDKEAEDEYVKLITIPDYEFEDEMKAHYKAELTNWLYVEAEYLMKGPSKIATEQIKYKVKDQEDIVGVNNRIVSNLEVVIEWQPGAEDLHYHIN